jgi:anti-sigma factor RsiW
MGHECSDYFNELNDYLDGNLDPGLCEEIEQHIGECDNCRIMVDTMKQTVILCRGGISEKLPIELEKRLEEMLQNRWNEHFARDSK